jgi:hypothetical protein
MSDLFPTATAKPSGTLAQVKAYWNAYPETFSREWHLRFPGKRSAPAREVFPHLSSAAPVAAPNRSVSDAPAPSAPLSPWRATAGATSGPTAKPPVGPEEFFDRAQEARAACSPLGGKIW